MVWPLLVGVVVAGTIFGVKRILQRNTNIRMAQQEMLEKVFDPKEYPPFSKTHLIGPYNEIMTQDEAQLILGVTKNSTSEEIKKAHRTLMKLNHPDAGGSTLTSKKLNEAKDLLITKDKL